VGQVLKAGEFVKLQVARITENGIYLDVEEGPEIFMPGGEIKGSPAKYEFVWVGLYLNKGRLTATMKLDKIALRLSQPAQGLNRGDTVTGMVYNVTEAGAFLRTAEGYLGHIPRVDMVGKVEIGQKVEGRVTFVREDGRLNLSMRPLKEAGRLSDAEKLLEFMRRRKGAMPYSDETPPEVIMDKFGISKKAFKRALGKLMKDGLVEQRQGWTHLCQPGVRTAHSGIAEPVRRDPTSS